MTHKAATSSPPRAPRGGLDAAGLSPSKASRYKGGQFIPKALLEREKKVAAAAYPALEREFGAELQYHRAVFETVKLVPKGTKSPVSLSQVEYRIKRAIRRDYSRAFLLGKRSAGDLTSMTDAEAGKMLAIRRDEYTYLRKFLADMDAGAGRLPYAQRMAYYEHALREAFWVGYILGDTSPDRRIWWHWGKTQEHCKDCDGLNARRDGVPIDEFLEKLLPGGIVPQSGKLECKGLQCQCWLSDEAGKPVLEM